MRSSNYYNRSNREEMMQFIPQNSKRILEVGCGEGLFLKFLKEQRGVETWGLEMNQSAASEATKVVDNIFVGDFNLLYSTLPQNYFDCVVFNDVLEHFVDPWLALENTKHLLAPNAVVVSSIPNFRYIGNLTEITTKADFLYKVEGGILDKTHLRFFTSKSMYRLFDECGYLVTSQAGLRPCKSWKEKLFIFLSFGFFDDMRFKQFANVAALKK